MKRIRNLVVVLGVLVAVAALAPSQAVAIGIFGVPSGNWTNSASWGATWEQYPFTSEAYIGGTWVPAATVCTATVDSASSVIHNYIRVGEQATADGTIVLDGNLTTTANHTWIGVNGRGTVNQASGIWNNGGFTMYLGAAAGAEGTYNLSGSGVLTNMSGLEVGQVNGGVGEFNLSGDGTVAGITSYARIGWQASSAGTVTQTGGTWDNSGKALYVGDLGSGTYNLSDSGVLTNVYILYIPQSSFGGIGEFNLSDSAVASAEYTRIGWGSGSTGTVTQTGGTLNNNDTSMDVGYSGTGTYDLSGDGVLTNLQDLIVGHQATGAGEFNLSGNGVVSDLSSLFVGQLGAAEFNMSGGSVAGIANATRIGNEATGIGTVTQTGGIWNNNGNLLYVGNSGSGTYNLGGNGVLTNMSAIEVGNVGVGEFNLSGGTVAGITSYARMGNASGSTGTVTQTGGTWDNNGKHLYVGNVGSGTYNISGGSLTNVDILLANGSGGGTVTVEGSSASINVNQIHMNSALGTLRVKPDATALSPINCSGQVYVNPATLEVDLSDYDGVGPLTLINYGSLNGSPFATVVTNTPGTGFEVDYTGGAITLRNIIAPAPPLDAMLIIVR